MIVFLDSSRTTSMLPGAQLANSIGNNPYALGASRRHTLLAKEDSDKLYCKISEALESHPRGDSVSREASLFGLTLTPISQTSKGVQKIPVES
eukprot:4998500-Ditylum_brightwellii.AAC.1